MITKFQNSEEIRKAFLDLLSFRSYEDEIQHNTQMLMYRFLSEVEILMERNNMTKKELAEKIGTSASYITQLYRGNKPLNMETVAKFQKVFNITFEIKAKLNIESEQGIDMADKEDPELSYVPDEVEGFWYFKSFASLELNKPLPCGESESESFMTEKSAA